MGAAPKVAKRTAPTRSRVSLPATVLPSAWLSALAANAPAPSAASVRAPARWACAAAVASISVPSGAKAATGASVSARRYATRSASESSGPACSVAAIRIASAPSLSCVRAQRQVSVRSRPAPKPRRRSKRLAPSSGRVAASLTTCAATSLPSKRQAANAAGVSAPKIAAPVGLAKRIRVPSSDHAQAGHGPSASGARRGSRSQNSPEMASLIRCPSTPPPGNHSCARDV